MIKWGIIGCGNVTEVKSGPAFNKVPGSQLVAVMRRNLALAEDYAKRHNVPRFYNNADELIYDPEVNAIYIATPPGSHTEYAIKALAAGKPVYIEKPMATSYRECMMINETAEKYGLPVFVAYYRRTLPGFLKVKELIENGAIGRVRFINIELFKAPSDDERSGKLSWRVDPEIAGGGHFFDLGSHQLDYLDFLFEPVEKVKSVAVNQGGLYKAEDFVSAILTFSENIIASGTWCFNLHNSSNRDIIEIFGEKGHIKFSTFSFEPISLINNYGTREYINERPEHVQYFLISQVVNELLNKGKAVSTGITAARTSRVMDEIVKEYYSGTLEK
ncbi:MAG: Gfo/Idh/MocA family oxidoreductase [Bacteroidales bacterium]|nr:Gfo/Idh/MocA family oxidoreductase [Bacteroidales bacterium]